MDTVLLIFGILLGIIGIVGSIVPGIPGPPLSFIGVLLMYFRKGLDSGGEPMGVTLLLVLLAVTIAVTVLDYVVPAWFTKITGGTKYASRGATIGLIAGLIFPLPIGMIAASLLGAFVGELFFANKDAASSVKSALGAFLGFLAGTGAKLISSAVMLYYIIVFI
ncbi:MAG: DUF456 domain-containing protein [Bacteroidales bacterium]|nr:DUF456 domain-containing protein [Bacteroidales bacterium]